MNINKIRNKIMTMVTFEGKNAGKCLGDKKCLQKKKYTIKYGQNK